MNKKAQFFLIATFIVITLFLSLVFVYNSSSTPVKSSNLQSVANNLKYEGIQIINNGYKYDSDELSIKENLLNISNLTSYIYKNYNFSILMSNSTGNFKIYNLFNGDYTDISSKGTYDSSNITLSLNTLEFRFKLNKGYNFYVVVIDEKQNERYVATA
jgi:hypothetical protein